MTDDESTHEHSAGEAAGQGPAPGQLAKMKARGFFPADYGVAENGKVYASGAFWSTLRFPAFPAVLPAMTLIAVVEVPFYANQTDHVLEMCLVDLDEQPAGFEAKGMFRTAPDITQKYGAPGLVPTVVPIQGLVFRRPGEYAFTLKVDEVELARYNFDVIQLAGMPIPNRSAVPPLE